MELDRRDAERRHGEIALVPVGLQLEGPVVFGVDDAAGTRAGQP